MLPAYARPNEAAPPLGPQQTKYTWKPHHSGRASTTQFPNSRRVPSWTTRGIDSSRQTTQLGTTVLRSTNQKSTTARILAIAGAQLGEKDPSRMQRVH